MHMATDIKNGERTAMIGARLASQGLQARRVLRRKRDYARDLPMPHNEAAMQYEDKSSTLLCFPGIVLKVMMLGAVATPQTSRDRASPGEVHKPRPV